MDALLTLPAIQTGFVRPTKQSRVLRKNQTPQEKKLWKHFRGRGFNSLKFRRQYEIGSYIVDFCCPEKHIIIELDGGGHDEKLQKEKDEIRDEYLKMNGWVVIRIWNNELDKNLDGILEYIQQILVSPSP